MGLPTEVGEAISRDWSVLGRLARGDVGRDGGAWSGGGVLGMAYEWQVKQRLERCET